MTQTLAAVADTVSGGSLLLAVPLALLAGFVSFASPCVLPLVPGYVGVVTGVTGAELEEHTTPAQSKILTDDQLKKWDKYQEDQRKRAQENRQRGGAGGPPGGGGQLVALRSLPALRHACRRHPDRPRR